MMGDMVILGGGLPGCSFLGVGSMVVLFVC